MNAVYVLLRSSGWLAGPAETRTFASQELNDCPVSVVSRRKTG